MKGLELSKEFYLKYGKPLIEKEFADFKNRIAVGLIGEGSECFGFDDEISVDHDFEPGFCIFVTREDYEKIGFSIDKAYDRLPKHFKGFERLTASPVGGKRRGVLVIEDFYRRFLGSESLPETLEQWLYIPTTSLATVTNGEVFCDELGIFSELRNELLKGYPKDIKLKKLSAHLIMMQQAGLYNYNRCIKRNENGAAQLSIFEFVKHTISVIYLLNNKYEPFYKWAYRGMRDLSVLGDLENSLVGLTELGNSEIEVEAKTESMEEICKAIISELKNQGLTNSNSNDLEKQAVFLQNKIENINLRNMHILEGI